ncbi:unnamed protein product [Pleuronectes platessa]|uniref:Protein shisa-5 n=1 Tax=Pleuronectes platessa TaxID=8262 RepID=A0A9N7V3V6_PLEPL|nr:unnamed protein product [Pleuronectes platessa]
MASGLCGAVVLVLWAVLAPNVFARDKDCLYYRDIHQVEHSSQRCYLGFCCGSCYNRYCCSNTFDYLSEDKQEVCDIQSDREYSSPFHMIIGIVSLVVVVLIVICCCVCPCCCLYKMCRKPRPVVATTTHTTVITSTPQNYPQQPTASPGHPQSYQGAQYQPYQPVPVQPGYGAQPMPQGYGAQPMSQGVWSSAHAPSNIPGTAVHTRATSNISGSHRSSLPSQPDALQPGCVLPQPARLPSTASCQAGAQCPASHRLPYPACIQPRIYGTPNWIMDHSATLSATLNMLQHSGTLHNLKCAI